MNWLDYAIIIIVAAGLIKGLMDGFVRQLALFVGLVVAIYFAGEVAEALRAAIFGLLGLQIIPPHLLTGICYTLAFGIITFVIGLLGRFVDFAIKMTPARPFNVLFGGAFGLCVAVLSLSLAVNVLAAFDSQSVLISEQTQQQSQLFDKTKNIVTTVYPQVRGYFNTQINGK
ncbi:hypothetical protein AGMMS49982_17400 [Bacteroidia bacterium]|nr:hypothetical protein SAMD00024442_164_2 [Candidatus Symbiothrix dinenymphae]GHT53772.1 hypothetical protein AGMMS49982_17400 [Bacteroidia bacterium]